MKIVIAPDSFKGCCTSLEVAAHFESGIRRVFPDADITAIEVADGGEGTLKAVMSGSGGELKEVIVHGAMGAKINARFGLVDANSAIVEMAEACGLTTIKKEERNPLLASSYGVGELILHALDCGVKRIYVGLGGSATNDCGSGMLQALGVRYYDEKGADVFGSGGSLHTIKTIDCSMLDKRVKNTEFIIMSDVTNPLCGEFGASNVFGRQKGASDDMVAVLDANLKHFALKSEDVLKADHSLTPGAGAAGGLGFAFAAYLNAKMHSGIQTLLDIIGFDDIIKDCDLVITGEGNLDEQSLYGKVPVGIAKRLETHKIPLIVIAGGIGKNTAEAYELGISSMASGICRVMDIEYALNNPGELLPDAAERAMRLIKIGIDMANR